MNYSEIWRKHRLKIIAGFFSVVLWFYVLASEPVQVERAYQVQFNTPKGFAVSNLVIPEIIAKIKGPRALMRQIPLNKNVIKVDLDHNDYKKQKEFNIIIDPSLFELPFGVSITSFAPKAVLINLEKTISKKVPIKIAFKGELPIEQNLVESILIPDQVMISGPKEVMRGISYVSTTPIDQSTFQNSGEISNISLQLDPRVKLDENMLYKYTYETKPKRANMLIGEVKIRFLASQRKIYPSRNTVDLLVLLSKEHKNEINKDELYVIADIPENASGNIRVPLKAVLPNDIHLLQIQPEYINVKVK